MSLIEQDAPTVNPTVRVAVLGGDEVTLDFQPGLTVREWLGMANAEVGTGQGVNVNGENAQVDDIVEPSTMITVASRVSNG